MSAAHASGAWRIDRDTLGRRARAAAPACDFWSLRAVSEAVERLKVRDDIAEAPVLGDDSGVMLTVVDAGGIGHAATADRSEAGLRGAFAAARALARTMGERGVHRFDAGSMPSPRGEYLGADEQPLPTAIADRIALLADACRAMRIDPRVVDRTAEATLTTTEQWLLTGHGGDAFQRFRHTVPNLRAVATVAGETQTRTGGGQYNGFCRQGGYEVIEASGLLTDGARVAGEAIALAMAPNCPTGTMPVLLMPDQMMLQIHESIGHPLELDRILGDERNFAGTSFVTLDLFGRYRYGSPLLNVSHDPSRREEFASFGFDDDGETARREMLIERGLLLRPLGGGVSLARARARSPGFGGGDPAIATARASSWNRAPIDRMSNLNVEPGDASLDTLVGSIDDGVAMWTNTSWSIDDARNKFQFGCEFGRRIRGGRLAEVVRNPNYRGVSATFWRSLSMVGDASTVGVLGTPFCGKGEPMQVVRVGHASPVCRFDDVAVFGGAA